MSAPNVVSPTVTAEDIAWLQRETERLGVAETDWLEEAGDASGIVYAEECRRLADRYARILGALELTTPNVAPTEEQVGRAARAIWEDSGGTKLGTWKGAARGQRDLYLSLARRALTAAGVTATPAALHTAFRAGVEWACGKGEITEPIRQLIDIAAVEYGENPDTPIASVLT